MLPFHEIINRIMQYEGEAFNTITNLPFTYMVEGEYIIPDRTDYRLSFNNIEIAYNMCPINGPGVINNIVRGPAYVWAILHDDRIRGNDY